MRILPWNRPLPDHFHLVGGGRFLSEPQKRDRGWLLRYSADQPPHLSAEPILEGTDIRFTTRLQIREVPARWPISPCAEPRPSLEGFSWDWLDVLSQPIPGLDARSLYWTPAAEAFCGEVCLKNQAEEDIQLQITLASSMVPAGGRNQIIFDEFNGRTVLTGQTNGLNAIVFLALDPAAKTDPGPCLSTTLHLVPREEKNVRWISCLSHSKSGTQDILDQVIRMDWPGEIAKRKVALQGQLKIETGDKDWDFLLALAQQQAQAVYRGLLPLLGSTANPGPQITPFQAYSLLQAIQPLDRAAIKNILDLTFRPGAEPAGLELGSPTPPLLGAEVLRQVQLCGYSPEAWSEHLPEAKQWIENWFSTTHDIDRDAIPELAHPSILDFTGVNEEYQPGSEEIIPFPYLESPGLGAILFRELQNLEELCLISGAAVDPGMQNRKGSLLAYLRDAWNPETSGFQDRDFLSHLVIDGRTISDRIQSGANLLRAGFQQPTRIGVQVRRSLEEEDPEPFAVILHGEDSQGNSRIEEIRSADFSWGEEYLWAVSESVFSRLDLCTLKGREVEGRIILQVPPTSRGHITQSLPLWAGSVDADQAQAIINNTLLNADQYWAPYGFRTHPGKTDSIIELSWNLFLGQAILSAGKRELAAELISRWMAALIPSGSRAGNLYPAYKEKTGGGIGEINTLQSLFPIHFLLQVLGIEFFQDRYLTVEGNNPFPCPLVISYRGVRIERGLDQTTIHLPGKDPLTCSGEDKVRVDLG